ncbi:MAG: tRNA-guanine transglycosylase [Anaerolineae bacterium]|nr:tRNA-guanine transglycosylase [Anaerolineae bacterium]
MMKSLKLLHGTIDLPVYLPDATKGVVRALDSGDLERCGVQALVMNTYHLMQHPGSTTIKALGGLHEMTAWSRPIITDSGGFQIYSLIRQNSKYGSINDKGAGFQIEDRKFNLTPEKSIQLQMSYGSDILICLDDCTHVDDPFEEQKKSVERTIQWAKRSRNEYERLLKEKKFSGENRPLLFAVIQGGDHYELRRQCAERLLDIGFDGYGYGGWPLDGEGRLLTDIFAYIRELVPLEFPLHALGVGHPVNIAACVRLGYPIFDSAMSTRDARNGRLYVFNEASPNFSREDWFSYLYIKDDKHIKTRLPISEFCDCWTCQHYSLGYLHHLYAINDLLLPRLTTIHNLRFMTRLMELLRHDS